MTCDPCQAQLLDYASDDLAPPARAEVASHLLGCNACRTALEHLRLARSQLSAWPDQAAPPGLGARTVDALEEELELHPRAKPLPVEDLFPDRAALAQRPPRKLFRPWLSPLAACALLAIGGYYAQVSGLQVRLGAEVFGSSELAPGALSVVRLSLFDLEDHAPLPHRKVHVGLRDAQGRETPLFDGESDARGQVAAKLSVPELSDGNYQLVVRALDHGEDATEVLAPLALKRAFRLQLSTDKPLYQPGQTIHARVLAFDAARHTPAADARLTFSVFDPKGSRIYKTAATVDRFGIASFDLPLAEELNLGAYRVAAELGGVGSEAAVQVARYSLPKFDLKVELDQAFVRPGEVAAGKLTAKYFFGKPVAHAKVVVSAGVFVDGFRTVAHQELETDGDGLGHFRLDLPRALPGTSLAEGNAVLQISAEATDVAGERAEKHAELIVAERPLALTAVAENGTLTPDLPNRVLVLVARPDGQPVAKATVSVDGTGQSAVTGEDGVAVVTYAPHGGRRDLSLTATAPDGVRLSRAVELSEHPSFALVRTAQSLYAAGQTVQGSIVATSALKLAYLDVVSEGRTVVTQAVDLSGGQGAFAVDLPAEVSGAVALEVYAVSGGELLRTRRLIYVADPRGLKVDVTVAQGTTKPGERAQLRFHVADEQGRPTAAGLGVSVVDESVFALASKDPAMLRAFLTLAEELRTPRFNLDPAAVFTSGKAQQAADLLFSASELPASVKALGHTDAQELPARKAALSAFRDKRTGTAWFGGLFMLGLLLEGVLRLFAEKLLLVLVRHKIGWMALGSGGVFVLVDLLGDDTSAAALLAGSLMVVGTGFLIALGDEGLRWDRLLRYLATLALLGGVLLTGVSLFGDNLRRLFGSSVDALAGTVDTGTGATRASNAHRNVTNFAGYNTTEGAPALPGAPKPVAPVQDLAANLAQHEKALGGFERVEQLRQRRQSTIQVIKGTYEASDKKPGALARAKPQNAVASEPAPEDPAPLSAEEKAEVRVRAFFPETLFWAPAVVTDAQGEATLEVPGADSITTWRAAVTASSADGRLGTGKAELKVFQDFFVDLDLPPVLTVGDEVSVPIAVHNYLDHPEEVTVEIEPATWMTSSSPSTYRLQLQPGQVVGLSYRLTATRFGPHQPLTVYAVGPRGKDAVRREVEVRPAGVPFETVQNGTAEQGALTRLALPEGAVPGASHAELRLYPSTFSAVMDGLENVLRMPSGCFEQTSSTTYPNALVLRYLRESKKGTPELLARGEGYLTTGMQRLLSFEVQGGGFEWFGRAPANQVLTAYGLLEFHDIAQVFDVDPAVIQRTQEFLVRRQDYDGSWAVDAKSLSDGLYRDAFHGRLTTTAYVTWALVESGYRGEATDRAARFLRDHLDERVDGYTLALAANALLALHPGDGERAVSLLLQRGSESGPKGSLHFSAGGATATSPSGDDADVETTALAASALLKDHRGGSAVKALKWLLAVRDPHGTWSSTQATVLALRALLEAAGQSGLAQSQGTLRLVGARGTQEIRFTPDQADVVQRVDLTGWLTAGETALHFEGDAEASFQLQVSGYRPRSEADRPALALTLDYDQAALHVDDTVQAKLTALYQGATASGMVLVQAAVPPGFEAVGADLEKLVAGGKVAKYANDGKQLTFYVDRLTRDQALTLTYGLRAKFPVRATAPSSSAYLYYQPAVHAESAPRALSVAAK